MYYNYSLPSLTCKHSVILVSNPIHLAWPPLHMCLCSLPCCQMPLCVNGFIEVILVYCFKSSNLSVKKYKREIPHPFSMPVLRGNYR